MSVVREERKFSPLIFRLPLWMMAGALDAIYVGWIGYEGAERWIVFLGTAVGLYALIAVVVHLLGGIFHGLGIRRRRTELEAAKELCWDVGILFLLMLGFRLNELYLPSIRDPASIAANLLLLVASLGLVMVGRLLVRRSGKHPVIVGLSIFLIALIVLASFAQKHVGAVSDASGKPNIILITLDTVRADHLGAYGYERDTSPNFDRFARENHLFTGCRTPAPLTSPAHASVFSGKMPHVHGVLTNISSYPEDPELPTIAAQLAQAGYRTVAFPAAVHMGREFDFDRGFQSFNQSTVLTRPDWLQNAYQLAPIAILSRLGIIRETYLVRDSRQVNRAFFNWLDLSAREKGPFFCWVHYFDAHAPYQPPEKYWRLYDPTYAGRVTGSQEECEEINSQVEETDHGRILPQGFSQADIDNMVARYDGEIRYQDESLGELFEKLKTAGIWDNTIIIAVSDHGEGMYDDGYFGHDHSLKEYEIRAACAIKGPDIVSPADRPLSLTDITSYIRFQGGVGADASRLTESVETEPEPNDDPYASMVFLKSHCWIDPPFKLVRTYQGEGRGILYSLYDLRTDPRESIDLFDASDLRSQEMKNRLEDWLEQNSADFPSLLKRKSTLGDIDPATLEMLRSLGYIY